MWSFTLVLWMGGVMGCGPVDEASSVAEEERETRTAAVETLNGLSTNGLSTNGLSTNGLSTNGLSTNGLSSPRFQDWFAAAPAERDVVMKYMVLCAVPEGESRVHTSAATGLTYTWQGQLGLAPGWSAGLPATLAEQRIITACLAAHANRFGIHVSISVLGKDTLGMTLPYSAGELATYSENEACFFGNLFNGEGIFAANDRSSLQKKESTPRACGLSAKHQSTDCPPITHVGTCKDFCTLDPTKTFYTQCTYNGVTYPPITTRILPADIYRCGDGVCQFTESCGSGNTYDSCQQDCGPCP